MPQRYIMTAFGTDRVGIVADVTRLLYENDCNLEDTRMSMLAAEFTLNLLFSCPRPDILDLLAKDCRRLEVSKGISAFVRPLGPTQPKPQQQVTLCTLHIEGLDQAGIVYKTSQFLADHNLNILQLTSAAQASPQSGATIYAMDIQIQVPAEIAIEQIEAQLNQLANELHVDIGLSH